VDSTRLFIFESDGLPVGQARVDVTGAGIGEISISLDPSARGRGLGAELIGRATARAGQELGLKAVLARIKGTNVASRRAFVAAGYVDETATGEEDEGIVVLRWSRPAA